VPHVQSLKNFFRPWSVVCSNKRLPPPYYVIIKALSDKAPMPRRTAPGLWQCFLNDGILCCKFQAPSSVEHTQLILPSSLRHVALQHLRNELGNLGLHKTMEAVKQRYYWPGYEGDIQKWIYRMCLMPATQCPTTCCTGSLGGYHCASHPFDKILWVRCHLPHLGADM